MYSYNTRKGGWTYNSEPIAANQMIITNGTGVLVFNGHENASGEKEEVFFRVSGEVDVYPEYTCPPLWSGWGNGTPVNVDLKDIKVLDENGEEFRNEDGHKSQNEVTIQRFDASGVLSSAMYSYNTRKGGWTFNSEPIVANQMVITNGTAFLIFNGHVGFTSGVKEIITLKLPSPIPAE